MLFAGSFYHLPATIQNDLIDLIQCESLCTLHRTTGPIELEVFFHGALEVSDDRSRYQEVERFGRDV
jgi:hypothetical protein